jgi:hypothetical protein
MNPNRLELMRKIGMLKVFLGKVKNDKVLEDEGLDILAIVMEHKCDDEPSEAAYI